MNIKFKNNLIIVILTLSIIPLIYFILPTIVKIINTAENSVGGNFEKYIVILSLIGFFYFIILFIKQDIKKLFLVFILLLAGFSKFSAVIHIQVYKSHILPPLTFTIFIFLIFILLFRTYKLKTKVERKFEKLLWTFAIIGSFTQFMNHKFITAFWLSLGAFWQWVALFYILSALITEKKYAVNILRCLAFAILIGIIFRIGSLEQSLINLSSGGERFRVSSSLMLFGPSISYGGYLSLIAISIIYFIKVAKNRNIMSMWILIFLIISFEMLQTMTRGALISFSVGFLLLLSWKSERKLILEIMLGISCTLPFFAKYIYNLITYRTFSLTRIGDIPGVYKRFYSWQLNLPRIFSNYGLGNGIGNVKEIGVNPGEYMTPHNILLSMCQSVGLFTTIIFLLMYIYVIKTGIVNSLNRKKNNIYPYLVVILISFFIFSNTTTTSILGYYPYASIIIFYLFLFISVFLDRFIEKKVILNKVNPIK